MNRSDETRAWVAAHDPCAFVLVLDPVMEGCGVPVLSSYVETFWLPLVGPSTLLLARHLANRLTEYPLLEHSFDLDDLAAEIGIGGRASSRRAGTALPIVRTIDRLCAMRFAYRLDDAIAVRPFVARLTDHQAARLPARLRALHHG